MFHHENIQPLIANPRRFFSGYQAPSRNKWGITHAAAPWNNNPRGQSGVYKYSKKDTGSTPHGWRRMLPIRKRAKQLANTLLSRICLMHAAVQTRSPRPVLSFKIAGTREKIKDLHTAPRRNAIIRITASDGQLKRDNFGSGSNAVTSRAPGVSGAPITEAPNHEIRYSLNTIRRDFQMFLYGALDPFM
ncbi:uncharacterized protein EI90DRAFT_3022504 [Cantharellus anzutake]|uniref:uncharacterized protein n=1 Tax=Cantharellus anzutake TaxID=1750568 RepID=UPI001908533F|nr:uncharacterized protein EI90DRAFT_3022504 [Cantharellus anzutake]KAF8313965.1 hypothetical protein EI90DRAFT_3022504 [Cantharellus anzutake]